MVNSGCTEPLLQEIANLHKKQKNKKIKKSDAGKIILKNTVFFFKMQNLHLVWLFAISHLKNAAFLHVTFFYQF